MKFGKIGLTCATLFLLSAVSLTAFAQAGGQAGAPGGGRQGGGQRGQRGGMTLATIPISVLDTYLKLTADQKTKIGAIQTQYKADVKALMPAPADAGAAPDPQARRDMMMKQREVSTKADTDIKAVLTDDQTKMVPDMTKELTAFRGAGIPVEVMGDMKITADQKTKITTISTDSQKDMQAKFQEAQANGGQVDQQAMQDLRKATHEKIMAVLTPSQKTMLETYLKDHPQPQGGGRRGGAGAAPPPPAH